MLRTQTGLDKTPGINRTLAVHDQLHRVGEVDLDLELVAVRLGRRVLGRSSQDAEPDEAKAKPSPARQPPSP
jgi:hypothetical protein